jgi:hypothetical protein
VSEFAALPPDEQLRLLDLIDSSEQMLADLGRAVRQQATGR